MFWACLASACGGATVAVLLFAALIADTRRREREATGELVAGKIAGMTDQLRTRWLTDAALQRACTLYSGAAESRTCEIPAMAQALDALAEQEREARAWIKGVPFEERTGDA